MTTQAFEPTTAYQIGVFVEVAYQMFKPGVLQPSAPSNFPQGYSLIAWIDGVDRVLCESKTEFFGFVAQSTATPSDYLVAIRGTDRDIEWLIDAEFFPTHFKPVPEAGDVEDGFYSIYKTLTATPTGGGAAQPLVSYLCTTVAAGSLTIAGHSLGAALANMLALDVVVNATLDPTLYTFAAPRVGFSSFAKVFQEKVLSNTRIYNKPDIVPDLPPLYEQVYGGVEIDSKQVSEIKHSILCYHELVSYLYTLNAQSEFSLGSCGK